MPRPFQPFQTRNRKNAQPNKIQLTHTHSLTHSLSLSSWCLSSFIPSDITQQLFYSVFKTLVGQEVVIELKNDLCIAGKLVSVDQFLNFKLDDIKVEDLERFPHMMSVKNCFIRGSVVRYVRLPPNHIDTALLQDAARQEAKTQAASK